MSDYNGFTEEERAKGGAIQTWAYDKGYLKRPLECSACGIQGEIPGEIIAHLEDYTEPITGSIFLCYRCHTMVHLRYVYPEYWDGYRAYIRQGWAWPLTRSRTVVKEDHCTMKLDQTYDAKKGEAKERTVLDQIHDGELHPGPREEWSEKMAMIMENKRMYEIPTDQMSLW